MSIARAEAIRAAVLLLGVAVVAWINVRARMWRLPFWQVGPWRFGLARWDGSVRGFPIIEREPSDGPLAFWSVRVGRITFVIKRVDRNELKDAHGRV